MTTLTTQIPELFLTQWRVKGNILLLSSNALSSFKPHARLFVSTTSCEHCWDSPGWCPWQFLGCDRLFFSLQSITSRDFWFSLCFLISPHVCGPVWFIKLSLELAHSLSVLVKRDQPHRGCQCTDNMMITLRNVLKVTLDLFHKPLLRHSVD